MTSPSKTLDADFLFSRLPAFYQTRDAELGGPLRALLEVLASQGQLLDEDISQLYDNWFIETCEDWLIPYIGDLLGVRGLYSVTGTQAFGQRAHVANTLALRRRKGTLPVLEQLAQDTTGWRAHAVEYFQQLGWTQHLNHVRAFNVRTPDLRQALALERVDGAFDTSAHTAEVRALPAGRYNIPHIGLHIWRLQAYAVQRGTAAAVGSVAGFFSFDPLGRDVGEAAPAGQSWLFNRPRTEAQISDLAQPIHVPEPLSRRALHEELSAIQADLAQGREPQRRYFSQESGGPVLRVWLDGVEVAETALRVCHLGTVPGLAPPQWRRPPAGCVGIDPVLGRIALPVGQVVARVEVAYAYGFPGDIGGGPYDRRPARAEDEATQGLFSAEGMRLIRVPLDQPSLAAALAQVQAGQRTLIRIDSDATEALTPNLNLPDSELLIEAVNQRRPVLVGSWKLRGNSSTRFGFSGLWIDGELQLQGGLRALDVRHCSLRPSRGGIRHSGNGPELQIRLSHSICGPIQAAKALGGVSLSASIIDADVAAQPAPIDPQALVLPDTALEIDRCTVLGACSAGQLEAGNSLFNGAVEIERRQQGCVRFCYLPIDALTPRRYRCQPELALQGLSPAQKKGELLRITPSFSSLRHGHAAYAQLRLSCAPEIRRGAEDGGEMGVWNLLQEPQREANLRQALDEYLRFGLEAGLIFVN